MVVLKEGAKQKSHGITGLPDIIRQDLVSFIFTICSLCILSEVRAAIGEGETRERSSPPLTFHH